jgi:EAL domain-containing protein (putative c-di-GMP-specific phosphodiesterase class I)
MSNSRSVAVSTRVAERRLPAAAIPVVSRLLLVGADLRWSRAVRAVAHELGGFVVHAVPSGQAAMTRLLDSPQTYSHVLLNPARDDGQLSNLLGLTCDEKGAGSSLLVLGRPTGAPSRVCVVAGPGREALRTALATGCETTHHPPPSVGELRTALAERRIITRYQPVVRMADREPAGIEALARLYHDERGIISPRQFVARLEDEGLGADLTDLVLQRILADITSPDVAPLDLTVALNVPLDVLLDRDAPRRFHAQREAIGVPASRLVIELTESRVVDDFRQLSRAVERLRDAGYRVALDDLSPGMPNYLSILDAPFTSVKLDKDVVTRSAVAIDAADFIKQMIVMAKKRCRDVIVEGVEDLRCWNRMRQAGADLAQGFFIARPLPAAVLPAWTEAWRARTDFD